MPTDGPKPAPESPSNCLGVAALVGEHGDRIYAVEDAERLLGIGKASLRKRANVPFVTSHGGTYVDARWVDSDRAKKLRALGVADVASPQSAGLPRTDPKVADSDGLGELVARLQAEVAQCTYELRQIGTTADTYKDLYFGRLPLGSLND